MDFFEHEERAKRKTSELVVLFGVALILILISVNVVAYIIAHSQTKFQHYRRPFTSAYYDNPDYVEQPMPDGQLLLGVTAVTLLIIFGGSAYKMLALSGGGPSVAQLMGGRPVDPNSSKNDERMLQNIVEEMSIASGVPVPRVYIMDDEPGINAFAAGYGPKDTVITVTRGALDKFTRDELQAVIGHEFSHILNRDMRLNLQLICLLHGILVISLTGMLVLRGLQYARFGGRRNDKAAGAILALLLIGGALYVIGSIGAFFGRLIQSAVSRQREFLADASSVQFTRNPAGMVEALKKLGKYSSASRVNNAHAMSLAHLFFANGGGMTFTQLLATHPPLEERIRAIDPNWDGKFDYVGPSHLLEEYGGTGVRLDDGRIVRNAGTLTPQHLVFAAGLLAAVPDQLTVAARDPFSSRAVVLALILNTEPNVRQKQLSIVQQTFQPGLYQELLKLIEPICSLPESSKLPLLDTTLPALRNLSPQQAEQFRAGVRAMIEADGRVTLFEFTLNRLVEKWLTPETSQHQPIEFYAVDSVRPEAAILLSALAAASETQTDLAFAAGARKLDPDNPPQLVAVDGLKSLDAALQKLARSSPGVKKRLLDAAEAAVTADGKISVSEAELLRAISATLDVPLPPMLQSA